MPEKDLDKLKEKLGRIYIPDERDANFPMKAMLPVKAPKRHFKYYWGQDWWGDQKATSQCVSYAWLHWLEGGSVTQNHKEPPVLNPTWLYNECQKNDSWEGTNYNGTSVRAGAKILQREGYISEYRWTQNIDELVMAVLTVAPVVVGTYWFYDMFFPNEDGLITATGQPMGGHAYVLTGVNTKKKLFRIKNSWSKYWGRNGYAYISFDDMEKLLGMQGEAALAVELKKE